MKRLSLIVSVVISTVIALLLCSIPAVAAQTDLTPKERRCANGITIMAHRGTGSGTVVLHGNKFSEDTIPAALMATRLGACGREYDLQISRDHTLFVHHDPTVDRMTNGHGVIKQHTASWVRRWRNPGGAPIATFEALLRATALVGGFHQQEFKPFGFADSDLQHAMDLDHKYIANEELVLRTSAQTNVLCKLHTIDKQYAKDHPDEQFGGYANGLINYNPRGRFNLAKVNDKCVDVLMLSIDALDRSYVRAAHQAGFEVSARSVNSVAAFKRVKSWNVDRVVTDKPWILRGRR
jgi:glycerophosphoryl diester phosphodiesterase